MKSILSRNSADLFLAGTVAAIVGAMIVPLPPGLLDALLALNLAASATLLVAALYARDALKVASFPTLLLLTTLFRLALNVSSTRLALLEAHAGDVIQAFGEFVIQGDYVVGGVIFAILTLVQFLVVAKGAERVAEVGARFTLDAMPGKQMAIDADLRSGAIDLDGARRRRRGLERESQLYGAMDGAMKFVKGDAIAGLIIVLINAVGGLIVGVLARGMTAGEAAKIYTLLAIGDGLVSQIPALCIAVSAGLVVTRVASEDEDSSLGADIGAQFFGSPRALAIVSGLLFLVSLMPLMPMLPFVGLSAAAGFGAWSLSRRQRLDEAARRQAAIDQQLRGSQPRDAGATTEQRAAAASAPSAPAVGVSPICLDLDESLEPLAREDENRLISRDLPMLRDALYLETGVRLPGIRARGGAPLGPGAYQVLVDEVPVARGAVDPSACYAAASPDELQILEIAAEPWVDAASGAAISRIKPEDAARVRGLGVRVRDAREQVLAHVAHVLRGQAANFLGIQEVQLLIDAMERSHPALVREATQRFPVALIADVLRRLVDERVSIRNLRALLETFADPSAPGDSLSLSERCRQALRRHISWSFAQDGTLYAHLADPELEQLVRDAVRAGGPGTLALSPDDAAAILDGVRTALGEQRGGVLLASPDVRRYLRKLCEGNFPELAVLTYSDLNADLQIRPLGRIAPLRSAA